MHRRTTLFATGKGLTILWLGLCLYMACTSETVGHVMGTSSTFRTLADLQRWAAAAPRSTSLDVAELAELLAGLPAAAPEPDTPAASPYEPATWRERLWLVPANTRLTLGEAAEALGKSRSWAYKRTGPRATEERIPCRRLGSDGELTVLAGELRAWIAANELIVEPGPPDAPRLRAM